MYPHFDSAFIVKSLIWSVARRIKSVWTSFLVKLLFKSLNIIRSLVVWCVFDGRFRFQYQLLGKPSRLLSWCIITCSITLCIGFLLVKGYENISTLWCECPMFWVQQVFFPRRNIKRFCIKVRQGSFSTKG